MKQCETYVSVSEHGFRLTRLVQQKIDISEIDLFGVSLPNLPFSIRSFSELLELCSVFFQNG